MADIYIISEGGGSQLDFWTHINKYIFVDSLKIISANGIKNVRNTYYGIASIMTVDSVVIIDIDNPIDNSNLAPTVRNVIRLGALPNVYVLSSICFEDVLLCFRYFKSWVYSADYRHSDRFIHSKYTPLLDEYRHYRNNWVFSDALCRFAKKDLNAITTDSVSTENIAAVLLSKLTNGICNFGTIKAELGTCWTCDCTNKGICAAYINMRKYKYSSISELRGKLRCGLLETRLHSDTKARRLYKYTLLNKELSRARMKFIANGYAIAKAIPANI